MAGKTWSWGAAWRARLVLRKPFCRDSTKVWAGRRLASCRAASAVAGLLTHNNTRAGGVGPRGHVFVQAQRTGRDALVSAVQIAEVQSVGLQGLHHPGASDEFDGDPCRLQAPAHVTPDAPCAHHPHRARH